MHGPWLNKSTSFTLSVCHLSKAYPIKSFTVAIREIDLSVSQAKIYSEYLSQGILKGKYHCTVDLLFDWFGIVCFANILQIVRFIQLIPNQSNRRSTVQYYFPL